MGKLYTYDMVSDSGLAPNPFWGVCTLAVCTPNHQGSRADKGDWIASVSDKRHGHQLIYATVVDERIRMDAYFDDPRFAKKKPVVHGTARQCCGDNFYHLERGRWKQEENPFHPGPSHTVKDTRRPYVFVGRRFWYLGGKTVPVPERFTSMFGGRGARVNHSPELAAEFKAWVERAPKRGLISMPRDFEGEDSRRTGPQCQHGSQTTAAPPKVLC